MLFARISPTAKIGVQQDPFNVTIIEAPYMTAIAQLYRLGESITRFEIIFGDFNIVSQDPQQPAESPFKRMFTLILELTAQELSTWEADDSIVLEIIANKLSIDILEIVNKEDIYTV